MENYEEARVTITKSQLSKLKYVTKNENETVLRITKNTSKMKNYLMNYF